jgi:hypothetical protein
MRNYCIDCKHYEDIISRGDCCLNPSICDLDPITGRLKLKSCAEVRNSYGWLSCSLYEPKPKDRIAAWFQSIFGGGKNARG